MDWNTIIQGALTIVLSGAVGWLYCTTHNGIGRVDKNVKLIAKHFKIDLEDNMKELEPKVDKSYIHKYITAGMVIVAMYFFLPGV